MQDRLRRLDSLFAEKVLGCKVATTESGDPTCYCDERVHNEWDNCCGDRFNRLSAYTRSLDGAFDAAQHYGAVLLTPTKDGWKGAIDVRWGNHETTRRGVEPCMMAAVVATADHPAEALVLACLRAVGCSEEELG